MGKISKRSFLSPRISLRPRNFWLSCEHLEEAMFLKTWLEALKMLLSRIGKLELSTLYCWLMLQHMETRITAAVG
jgi:hypothetical protein